MNDRDWKKLLGRMREGNVVPVVGTQLLLDADGASSLYARIATRVLQANGQDVGEQPLPPFRELNAVVTRLKALLPAAKAQDLYGDIDDALSELIAEGLAIPTPLKQLAQITDFRLMVTLTPDDLLARALRDQQRAVHEVVHAPKLATSDGTDIGDWKRQGSPVELLYLFGKAAQTPLFAIHDEDVLEYAHNIISHGSHAPDNFLGALRERDMLLIGCNFPDWLCRFLLRATRKERLAEEGGRQWLVERLMKEDPFIGFLGAYSPYTEVLADLDPAQFVAEMHRRWVAGQSQPGAPAAMPAAEPEGQPQSALFFISYSRREDLPSAQKLHQTLIDLGVAEHQIWFDKEELKPGEEYRQRILEGISSCRHFLPLISQGATDREEGFVFSEWEAATNRLSKLNRDDYLVPLVVDAENQPNRYRKPKTLLTWQERNINFGHAPYGEPDKSTREFLTQKIRASRKEG